MESIHHLSPVSSHTEYPYGISVVLPCLNESSTIELCIQEIHKHFEKTEIPFEIIVADNSSTDDSVFRARSAGVSVIEVPLRGYGAAVDAGIRHARYQVVVFADADYSYPFTAITALALPVLNQEVDWVVGSRYRGVIEKGSMPFLNRYIGTPLLSILIRSLYTIAVTDCCSGMRALSRARYEELSLRCRGMEYAVEMYVGAARQSFRYREIGINYRKDLRGKESHLRRWSDGLKSLMIILCGVMRD